MTQELFRKEAIESKSTSRLGCISLAQPLRLWTLTVAAVLVALTAALFLTFGTYTRRARVMGQVVPSRGLVTVPAPVTGVASRVDVREGTQVHPGQILAVVTVPSATVANGDTMVALDRRLRSRQGGLASAWAAQQQLFSAQVQGFGEQLLASRRELRQVEAEIATRRELERIARATLGRLLHLADSQYVSTLQTQQQEAAVLEQVSEVQSLQRQALATRRTMAQLNQALQEIPAQRQTSEAGYQHNVALLEQERVETESRNASAVTAPVAGIVATQLVLLGQAVEAGQPLMSLLPVDGALEAELLAPSYAIGFIEPGDRVLLRYQAYPYQKFGHHRGRVVRISRGALGGAGLGGHFSSTAKAGESYYRITVSLEHQFVMTYGKEVHLMPGMLVEADVLGERRRLIEWVLEPLYSLRGKLIAG